MANGRNADEVVIHGRSKERSDAAQTRGSIPLPTSVAAVQNDFCLAPSLPLARGHAWILGSVRPLRSRSARG
ncbi:hypothetical protein FJ987_00400 [Mesorhizobium sp. CU2]|nr:hypothetical protein FJ988_00520 [Mesorhizobium sp. CU3]TPO22197.1 hypothetical protein FJ987_00400 [Mesorhizobium sp. CU2]